MTGIRAWIRRGHAERAEVTEGRRGRRRTEDADVRRGGEGRHDGRKYNKLLFGERGQERTHERGSWGLFTRVYLHTHTHKKAWLIESKHQSAVLHWSPDPDGQRSTGNDALAGELLMNWQYLPTRNNRGAKGKSVDTHHPSVGALTTEVSLPYSDVFIQVLSSAIVKNNEYATKHQDSAGLLRQV